MKRFLLLFLLLLASPVHSAPLDFEQFFRGRTQGEGALKVLLKPPKRIRVESAGVIAKDGTLVLTQRIDEQGERPRIRQWRLRRTGPTRFEGSLTDAVGPVVVDLVGDRARIRYEMKNKLRVEQWLSAGGPKTLHNEMRIRRIGLTVARVKETIRKLD